MIKRVVWKTFRLSYVLIGILLIVLALLTVTARVALPLLANYKGSIEQRVSDYMQSPVSVDKLSLRWKGFGPVLYASDVVIEDNAQRNVTLDELHIGIDVAGSLLRGRLNIKELSLVGADLVVEIDEQGQFQIYGVSRSGSESTSANTTGTRAAAAAAVDEQLQAVAPSSSLNTIQWLLNVQKIALLDTQVTLLDRQSNQSFVMDEINILAQNSGDLHRLRVQCVLPASLGGVLEAGVDLRGSTRQLSQMSGDLYFNADDFNLTGVMELLALGGVSNNLGALSNLDADAAVELWGTWQDGQLSSLRGPITLVNLERADTSETLLDRVGLNLQVNNTPVQTQVIASNPVLSLGSQSITLDELQFSRSKSVASTASTEPGTPWQLQASGDSVQFDLLTSVIAGVLAEVQPALSSTLKKTDISGSLNEVSLTIRNIDSQPIISLSANTENLRMAGNPELPEFGPLSASVSMLDSQGTVSLSAEQIPLRWLAASDQQQQVDRLSSTWNIDLRNTADIALNGNVQLDDDGITTSTDVKVALSAGVAPHLDIRSRFSAIDVTRIKDWLPEKLISPVATEWIDQAIVAGEATDGQLLFFGHSDEFPFRQGEGVFRGSVDINNGTLAFLPGWPDVSGINATLEVDGLTFTGVADKGLMKPFELSSTSFAINNITAPVLKLSGTGAGSLPDLTNFAVTGPLASVLEPAMSDISGTGNTQMDLELTVSLFTEPAANETGPLIDAWTPLEVDGSVFLAGNEITFDHAGLVLKNATGAVGFNENGIAINKIEGDLLSQRVRLAGDTAGVGDAATTTVSISGVMEANDLLAHYENTLDQFIRGTSFWNVAIRVPHSRERLSSEGVQLDISSDLVGSQLLLPAPFNKSSSQSVPFRLSTRFTDSQSKQQWQADYGEQLRARVNLVDDELKSVLVELNEGTNLQTESVVADSRRADSTSEQPDSLTNETEFEGIRLQGRVSSLAADGWIETVSKYIESLPDGDADNPTPILPVSAELAADSLRLGNTSFGKATLLASTETTYLNFDVTNRSLQGSLQYPRRHWEKETPLIAKLELLDWSVIEALQGNETESAVSSGSTPLDPRLLPPIDARLSLLRRDDVQLRNLAMRTEPNVSGLDITALGFAYDTMRLVGQGHWYLNDPQEINATAVPRHITQLNLVLQGSDFGTGLDSLGLDGILDDTQGSMEAQLEWPGALYQLDLASLDGSVDLDLTSGSIVPLEPGAGRMVGLFALQTLPRRLNLDFRDMTAEGLAFSRIAGSATVANGVIDTPLLQLTGPIGVVDIAGTSNLSTEEFDQQITVLPRVSAALPIIGALSGGASAGIGALVAAGFLKAIGVDFDRIGLRTYKLTGQWTEPVLTPIPSDFLGRR